MSALRKSACCLLAAISLAASLRLAADSGAPPPHAAMERAVQGHAGHQALHAASDRLQAPGQDATVRVTGVVVAVLPERHQLKVRHEAIEAWQMGAMQMRFDVAPQVPLQALQPGQRIRFRLRREGIGHYRIMELE